MDVSLFPDVDGTLVTSVDDTASKLHKAAFTHCFKAGFGLDVDIDEVQHQGSTDPLIILAVLDKFDLDVREVKPIFISRRTIRKGNATHARADANYGGLLSREC